MGGFMFIRCVLLSCIINQIYGQSKAFQIGDPCHIPNSTVTDGLCQEIGKCPEVLENVKNGQYEEKDIICGFMLNTERNHPYVCCPNYVYIRRSRSRILDASAPKDYYFGFNSCKNIRRKRGTKTSFRIPDIPFPTDLDYDMGQEQLSQDPNDTSITTIAGGIAANAISTRAMALIGVMTEVGPEWFCDGILINENWILTAAHCLERTTNIIRLGEYHIDVDLEDIYDDPIDYGVKNRVVHEGYKLTEGYHDIALVELNSSVSNAHNIVTPMCLYWSDDNTFPDIANRVATVIGWGATVFNGDKSPILQEVELTVFNTSVCEENYSQLPDYNSRWPHGIKLDTTLCVGDILGKKDACKGDSGGPVLISDATYGQTLAGVVSKGNGCGLHNFPGIYTPIYNAEHLSWIKETAFRVS